MVDSEDRTRTSSAAGRNANANALPPGSLLRETYVVERELGEGGFGITYLASHTLLKGKHVAIKEYLPRDAAYRDASASVRTISEGLAETYEWGRRRFIEEANHLHRISPKEHPSPNIVCVQDVFEENNTAYMVMDFVEGRSLRSAIEANEEFDEARLKALLFPLLDVLETIHGQGLIHRDITPSNIILRGEEESPVLIDFGSARHEVGQRTLQRRKDGPQPTMTQVVAPGYSPIEQYEGSLNQDGRTDIYSLAATLYYAAFKVKVVNAPLRQGTLRESKRDPVESAKLKGRGRYSKSFLTTLDRGLALYQNDRPANVKKWREMFGAPDVAAPSSAPSAPRAGRWLATALVLVVLAGGAYIALQQLESGKQSVPPLVVSASEQLVRARETLARNPTDSDVVVEAQRLFVAVRSMQPQNPIARAGDAGCDALLQLLGALNRHDFQRAEIELNKASQSLQAAKVEPAMLVVVKKLFESMRDLARAHALLKSVGLDGQGVAQISALLNGAQGVEDVRQAVQAGSDALEHLSAAAAAAAAMDFQLAIQRLSAAENAAAGMDLGTVQMSAARGEVASKRERALAQLSADALSALGGEPLSEQSIADARARYQRIETIVPDSEAAKLGLEMADLLESLGVEAAAGRLRPKDSILASVQPLAQSLSLDPGWVERLTAKLASTQREWLAASAVSALVRAPTSSQALADARSALQRLVAESGDGTLAPGVLSVARSRLSVVEVLGHVVAMSAAQQFTAATSEVETLNALVGDAELDPALVSAARAAVAEQRSRHVDTLIARGKSLLVEGDSIDALRQARDSYLSVLEIDPGHTHAQKGVQLVDSVAKVEALERARDVKAAWSLMPDLEALVLELGLGTQWMGRHREALETSSRQQVELSLARAMDALRLKPLQSESLELGEHHLGEAGAVAIAAQDAPSQQLIASMAQSVAHYREAADALARNEFATVKAKLAEASVALAPLAPEDAAVTEAIGSFVAARVRDFCAGSTAGVDSELQLVRSQLRDNPLNMSVLAAAIDVVSKLQRGQDAASEAGCSVEALSVAQASLHQLQQAGQLRDQKQFPQALAHLEPLAPDPETGSVWGELLQVARTHVDDERRLLIDVALAATTKDLGASPLSRDSLLRSRDALAQATQLAQGSDFERTRLTVASALIRDLIRARDAMDEPEPTGRTKADRILVGALSSNSGVGWATQILLDARSQLMADVTQLFEEAIGVLSEKPVTEHTLSAALERFERARQMADERDLAELKRAAQSAVEGADLVYRARLALSERRLNLASEHLTEAAETIKPAGGDTVTPTMATVRGALSGSIATLLDEAARLKPRSVEYMPKLLEAVNIFGENPKDVGTLAMAEEIVQTVLDTMQQDLPPAVKLKQALQFQRDAIRACEAGDTSAASRLAEETKGIIKGFGLPVDSLQGPVCDGPG